MGGFFSSPESDTHDLICNKCGQIIKDVKLREVDRKNTFLCPACDR